MRDTLGILVHSTDYFDYVTQLALAALGKGKRVRIHLLQQGVLYASEKAFGQLTRSARITICKDSYTDVMKGEQITSIVRNHLTPSQRLAAILDTCDRWVAF